MKKQKTFYEDSESMPVDYAALAWLTNLEKVAVIKSVEMKRYKVKRETRCTVKVRFEIY